MKTPTISIIVPSFNAAEFIGKTLDSILGQDYPGTECIVVDGGSTDETLDILKGYGSSIIWTSGEDTGQSDAINKGLRLATGEIVAYICADDTYESGCFWKVADYLLSNPHVKWVYGKCKIMDSAGAEIRAPLTWYKSLWQRRYSYCSLLINNFIAQPAVFWRRELLADIGFLNVHRHLAMDYEYWLRIGAKYSPGFLDAYLARFRVHPCSKSTRSFFRQAREALSIARQHTHPRERMLLAPLQCFHSCLVVCTYGLLGLTAKLGRCWGILQRRRSCDRTGRQGMSTSDSLASRR